MSTNFQPALNGRNTPLSQAALKSGSLGLAVTENKDARPTQYRKTPSAIAPSRNKTLWLPHRTSNAKNTESSTPAIIYRNSSECRPYHSALHAFEGAQFGDDFSCDSQKFEHWFNAESYFCAAAFSSDGSKILSLIAMLFVTETSALDFLAGRRREEELMPFDKSSDSSPVVYYSSMISKDAMSSVHLYKSILRDISMYKSIYKIAPCWGFSIALTDKAIQHLTNSGFHPTEEKNFMNKYTLATIDPRSARSKIWTSIFSEPKPALITEPLGKTKTLSPVSHLHLRNNSTAAVSSMSSVKYRSSRTIPAEL
ncbi:MAG: hypothetical protein ACU837_07305 [Gammaproteobacteria bacterium]